MTCAQFLAELNEYLDEAPGGAGRAEIERHLSRCPKCRVIVDTTKKTVRVFRGQEPCLLPPEVEARLLAAIERRGAIRPLANG